MADKTQHVMWTALPNGVNRDGDYHVSVLVSPELTRTDAVPRTLDEFPDMLDWPAVLARTRLAFEFDGIVVDAPVPTSTPDSSVWQSVFPPSTFVRSHSFEDMRGTVVLSYPIRTIHNFVRDMYADLAASAGDDLPDRLDHFRHLGDLVEYLPEPRDVLKMIRNPDSQIPLHDPRTAFSLLQTYHRPLSREEIVSYSKKGPDDPREDAKWRTHRLVDLPKEEDFKDLIDFHQVVSSTNQYRGLLRQLGLVLDFTLPADSMPAADMTDRLRVVARWSPTSEADSGVETRRDTAPVTVTRLEPRKRFQAVLKDPSAPMVDGYLRLDERFDLVQMDVDGAGMKVKNFARSLLTMRGASKNEPEPRAGAPALQTAGIMLVQPLRGAALSKAIDRSGALNDTETGGGDVELVFEDLIRGYHVDILDVERGRWESLCRRDGLIDLLDTLDDVLVRDEEGTVRLGVTQSADGEEADIVKLYEGLCAWTGWSLSAPQPGLAIDTDDSVAPLANTAPPGMTFQANFRPHKGSLPSLRYGQKYRMRVRIADLALNAEPWSPKDVHPKPAESPEVRYLRYEPVEPPAFALGRTGGVAEKPGDGEAMTRIAIRTFNDDPADNTVPVSVTERRHVVASRNSVKQAETHGKLDDANGRVDPGTYGVLAARDMPLESAMLSFDGVESEFPVATDGFVLPYLPDPFAHAVATRFLGPADVGVPSLPDVPYYPAPGDAWPDARPFQIRILEDPNALPEFDATTRTLNVPLAKGDIVRLRLSHVLPDGVLDQMGVWQWFLDRVGNNNPGLIDEVRKRALAGGNWTLTPWTEIELIHAVQKPLVRPEIVKLGVGRPLGETAARLRFLTPVDSHSTDKLDLFGRWNEPEDPLAAPGPRSLIRRGHAHERKLDYGEAAGMNPPGSVAYRSIRHEFGDTRYRRVLYRLEATTRFREFMPPAIRAPLVDGETNPQLKVISDESVGWVPNSAPPPAPDVLYVIPTFGWTRRKVGKELRSWRDGGGLRVYLNRPWFVSGHNEMLAVVTPPDNATRADIDGPLKPFVTQWGTDPIWASTNIKTPSPALSSFPMAIKAGPLDPVKLPEFVPAEEADLPAGPFPLSNLANPTLPETSPLRVNVAPHAVGYDAERQLWYCDIVVDPGRSYFPFIRLALARYHPVSAPRAHLSPIVTTEFLQLTPDRFAAVAPASTRNQYTVGVYGHAYTSGPGAVNSAVGPASQKPFVRITVEQLDETLGEDFGWKTLPGITVKQKRRIFVRPKTTRAVAAAATSRATRLSASRRAAAFAEAMKIKAENLLASRDYTAILKNPAILALLQPPAIWEGTVTLPGSAPAKGKLRLAIREYERHEIDTDHIQIPVGGPDPRLRLVYAETVPLN